MEISAEELALLPEGSYIIYDIRGEYERSYGAIPGSVGAAPEELRTLPPELGDKKIIICCARGVVSLELAEGLCAEGFDAYSLKDGYIAWLRREMQQQREDELRERVEQSLRKKFRVSLMSSFIRALKTYRLVNEGDRIAVCISGGKDSMLMAKLFQELKRYSDVNFDIKYLVMDPGYNADNRRIIEDNARALGIPVTIFAQELGCNKIALGHHYDDVIETILMGMLHGAQIQSMMPKLHSTNFPGMELIRPMYLIREDDIKAWRDYNGLHFIQCACRFTDTCTSCGDGQNRSKRQETKELIRALKKSNPDVEKCIFKSVENVHLDTLIAYKQGGVRHHFLDDYDEKA